jgi:shikimate kinase
MLIFLIGYMGSGKTTMGKLLAEKLGYWFIDMDDLFVEKHGITIPGYFHEKGEFAFREGENDILKSLLSEKDAVIATGGGTPCYFNNMEVMNAAGITIYLKVSMEEIYNRLKDDAASRPMLQNVRPGDLKEFIANHLKEREKDYLKAKVVFGLGTQNLQDLISLVH